MSEFNGVNINMVIQGEPIAFQVAGTERQAAYDAVMKDMVNCGTGIFQQNPDGTVKHIPYEEMYMQNDTRDDFERHFKLTIRQQEKRKNGDYWDSDIQRIWYGWQAAWNAAMERSARIVEGGSFLHDQAPTAKFAKEAAAAIRREIPS